MNIENLLRLSPRTYMVLFLMSAAVLSGFLLVYVFDSSLYNEMELARLCILSVAISAPLLVTNCALGMWIAAEDKETVNETGKWRLTAVIAASQTMHICTVVVLLRVFIRMNVKVGVIIGILLEILAAFWLAHQLRASAKKATEQRQP